MLLAKAIENLQQPEPADIDRASLSCVADALNTAILKESSVESLCCAIAQCHYFVRRFGLDPMLSNESKKVLKRYV